MKFKDNPKYSEVFTLAIEGELPLKFYVPNDLSEGYHVSRFAAAQAQSIYSSAGATADVLNELMDKMIMLCNDTKKTQSTIRTDIGILASQIKYRTKYPVDEDCCLRMSAIYCFLEGEDPDKVSNDYTNKKVRLAKDHPELYTFFLHMGIEFTPEYRKLSQDLKDMDYFRSREEAIRSLTPIPLQKE